MYIFLIVVGGTIFVLDQLSKFYIQNAFYVGKSVSIIGNFFRLTYIRNPGTAFGLFPDQKFFFMIISFLTIALIFSFYKKISHNERWLSISLSLILGGASGNLIDRLRIGEVIDFLDFGFGCHRWPAFNLADSAICVGVGIFCITIFRKK